MGKAMNLMGFDAAALGIVAALVFGGWKVIVGVTGHDVTEQRDALARAIEAGTEGSDATGFACMEGELHTPDDAIPLRMTHFVGDERTLGKAAVLVATAAAAE